MTKHLLAICLTMLSVCGVVIPSLAQPAPEPVRFPLILQVEIGRCAAGDEVCVVREVLRKESPSNGSLTTILGSVGSSKKPIVLTLNERNAIIHQIENLPPSSTGTATVDIPSQSGLTMQISSDGSVVLKHDDAHFEFDRDSGPLLRTLLLRANATETWINGLGL
jgi:hypothetical protein